MRASVFGRARACLLAAALAGLIGRAVAWIGPDIPDSELTSLRAGLSSPAVLNIRVSYTQAADLITDGLSAGKDPLYVLPVPRFIFTPNTVQDVVAAVQFAARFGLKVAARGSGHQLAGIALPERGVTIDMKNLNSITYDPVQKTATVQMGARSGAVAAATVPLGVAPVVGTCSDVGVAGFTLHGGNGWASRFHGAASDNVLSLEVVTVGANKTAVLSHVDAQSDPDLFFGMRGAGAMLGVAVSMTVKTFPVPDVTRYVTYTFSIAAAPEVLKWFGSWYPTTPPQLEPQVALYKDAGGHSMLDLHFYLIGPNTTATDVKLAELAAYAANRAVGSSQGASKTYDFMTDGRFCGNLTGATYWNTYYTANMTLDPGVIAAMVGAIQATSSPNASLTIEACAAPAAPGNINAYGFRGGYQLWVGDAWDRTAGGAPADGDAGHIAWVKQASAALIPLSIGRYINQLMFEFPDDSRASYEPATFARLALIKAARDPLGLFRDLDYAHPVGLPGPNTLVGPGFGPFAPAPAPGPAPALSIPLGTALGAQEAPVAASAG